MVTHGSDFELLRKLKYSDCQVINRRDKFDLIRGNILHHMERAFLNSAKGYNLRSNSSGFKIGETVYTRNFVLSNAGTKFYAKFAPKFIQAEVISLKGNNIYELRDAQTGKCNFYHGKDIRKST